MSLPKLKIWGICNQLFSVKRKREEDYYPTGTFEQTIKYYVLLWGLKNDSSTAISHNDRKYSWMERFTFTKRVHQYLLLGIFTIFSWTMFSVTMADWQRIERGVFPVLLRFKMFLGLLISWLFFRCSEKNDFRCHEIRTYFPLLKES
jgi:hypothetical protein